MALINVLSTRVCDGAKTEPPPEVMTSLRPPRLLSERGTRTVMMEEEDWWLATCLLIDLESAGAGTDRLSVRDPAALCFAIMPPPEDASRPAGHPPDLPAPRRAAGYR